MHASARFDDIELLIRVPIALVAELGTGGHFGDIALPWNDPRKLGDSRQHRIVA